jgi:hypothetical protein
MTIHQTRTISFHDLHPKTKNEKREDRKRRSKLPFPTSGWPFSRLNETSGGGWIFIFYFYGFTYFSIILDLCICVIYLSNPYWRFDCLEFV